MISSRMNAAEQEAALPLQARLAQQAFEGAVGHGGSSWFNAVLPLAAMHRMQARKRRNAAAIRRYDSSFR